MSDINDQASGLARPHVSGECIRAFIEIQATTSSKGVSQACQSSPRQAEELLIVKQSERPSSLNKSQEEGIESDRLLRFNRKAER